jgi:ketosteroid isomerase-like protein
MTRIALPIGALAATVLAVGVSRLARQEPNHTAGHHGLDGWSPRKITDEKQEKKEIEALLQEMHAAYRNGDQAAVAARIEFPVLMITDDWKGEVLARSWDRETWMNKMAPLFQHPVQDLQRAHQHDIFVVSDSLASVEDEQSVMMGKKKVTIRNSSIVVRKDRSWFVRATVEGGWGDTPIAKPAPSSGETSG